LGSSKGGDTVKGWEWVGGGKLKVGMGVLVKPLYGDEEGRKMRPQRAGRPSMEEENRAEQQDVQRGGGGRRKREIKGVASRPVWGGVELAAKARVKVKGTADENRSSRREGD